MLAAAAPGCASTSGSSNNKRGKAFLHVFVDDNAKALGPMDVQVLIDDKLAINRNFSLGRNVSDGKYLLELPVGRHRLTAQSSQANSRVTRSFTIKDEIFIELYLTKEGKAKLTPKSKISIAKFVIKKMKEPRDKQFHPALWTRMTERDFTPVKTAQ
jgi:hypothetical protein